MQNLFNWSVKTDTPEFNLRSFLAYDHKPLLQIQNAFVEETSPDVFRIDITINMNTPYYPSSSINYRYRIGEGIWQNSSRSYSSDENQNINITFVVLNSLRSEVTFEVLDNSTIYNIGTPSEVNINMP